KGVLKDYKEAVKWYTKAANQGYASAQYNLGWMYAKGYGVLKDYKEAVKWYTKAANQGVAKVQSNLGWMYERGIGVIKDKVQAHMWYNLASISGKSKYATQNRDIIEKEMSRAEIQEANRLAREWLRKHQK
ncbi:MAG: tetratricopeptide repeat protein, partial [Nitrospinota bacterium]|nr:tetratricopeptide repeat protein [Nitrospinota bacterium]